MSGNEKNKVIKSIFDYDPVEREAGDDFGIYFYAFCWFFFGVTLIFFKDPVLEYLMDFYIQFEIFTIGFLGIYWWRQRDKQINRPKPIMAMKMIGLSVIFMAIMWVVGNTLTLIFSGNEIVGGNVAGDGLKYIMFEFFRLIPIEEMVFRGLGIEIFLMIEKRTRKTNITLENGSAFDYIKKNMYFLIGGITNSILFGVLHFRAYPFQIHPLIYLVILGFFASWLRFKYGLLASMIFHGINNFIAMQFPGGYSTAMMFQLQDIDYGLIMIIAGLSLAIFSAFLFLRENLILTRMQVFIELLVYSITGYFIGSIFNYHAFPAGGLNRFLFIFLIPPIIIFYRKRRALLLLLVGLAIGLFLSDFRDFINVFISMNVKTIYTFILILLVYIYFIYYLYKFKRVEK